MAARQTKPSDEQPSEKISTREYAAGEGWSVGNKAPADAFRALDASGTGEPTGPIVHEHPGGYARLVVAKGQVVTEGVKKELDAAKNAAKDEQPSDENAEG